MDEWKKDELKEYMQRYEEEVLEYADSIRHARLAADTTTVITSQ
jgi:hypothetical protein